MQPLRLVRHAAEHGQQVVRRFPACVLLCLLGTGSALAATEGSGPAEEAFVRLMWACIFGLPLTVALSLVAEGRTPSLTRWLPTVGVLAAAGFAYWLVLLPTREPRTEIMRAFTLILAAHLTVAVVPFVRRVNEEVYWAFHVRLFLRFLLGALYAGVIFGGLALALLSIDRLLGLHIKDVRYSQLWLVMAGIFHPLFVLSGIDRLDTAGAVGAPAGLRRFVQFVLVPLTAVYVLILYLYAGRIALQAELPNGWVGLPVLVLSVIGLLAGLLLHPWTRDPDHPWVDRFRRGFFALTLPLTGLLALSIGVRVNTYGITEPRYYVVILTAWLALVCGLHLWRSGTALRFIPTSLLILALVGSFGPWGATAWGRRSQSARANALLEQAGMLATDGTVQRFTATSDAARDAAIELREVWQYLHRNHGPAALRPWLIAETENFPAAVASLDLPLNREREQHQYVATQKPVHLDTGSAARVVLLNLSVGTAQRSLRHDGWTISRAGGALEFVAPDGAKAAVDLTPLADGTSGSRTVEAMTRTVVLDDGREIRFVVQSLNLHLDPAGEAVIQNVSLLVALPSPR